MKRNIFIAIAVFLLSLILTDVVMAAYYINIDVTESNGTDYDMLALNVSMDIDYLADNGFIDEDGMDVRVTNSQGSPLPFMLADDKLLFASAIVGNKDTRFQMTTDNTPLDSCPVIVGDGGYVTISDSANLELGNDFELEWDGYIATDVSDDLISKTDAFLVTSDGAGHITATIYGYADYVQDTFDSVEAVGPATTRVAQRIDDVPECYITQISFRVYKYGNPTGTAYIRVRRVSDDGIVGTIDSIDVSTFGTEAWHDFTGSIHNPSTQDLRFTLEYSGGDGSNNLWVRYNDGDADAGVYSKYAGSWSDVSGDDEAIKIYCADVSVTASVETGEHNIKVAGDGTDLKIYEDDAEEDSATIIPVLDNGNNFVLGSDVLPYYDSYKHTTSDTLRITYEPDSIISGTTLPNEENPGTYDGTITWGGNPAGISIETSGLEIEESYYFTGGDTSTPDIFDPEPAELVTGIDSDKLDHNPLSPGVEGYAAASNGAFTESLVWYGIAWFSVIACGIALVVLVREHLAFAAAVSFGLCIFWYVSGVFDYWVLIIFGILFGASLIHERMPTW